MAPPVLKHGSPAERICRGMTELRAIGLDQPPRIHVAVMAGYPGADTAGFKKAVREAKKAGFIDYPTRQTLRLSSTGRQFLPLVEPPKDNAEMLVRLQAVVEKKKAPKKASTILLGLLADGNAHTLKSIAAACDYPSHTSSGFKKMISTMSSLQFLDRTVKGVEGSVGLNDVAFPFGRNGGSNKTTVEDRAVAAHPKPETIKRKSPPPSSSFSSVR